MQIRPVTSLETNPHGDVVARPCGAVEFNDGKEFKCGIVSVGHLWPSDWFQLKRIYEIKSSRNQAFPWASTTLFCRHHGKIYATALDNLISRLETSK